MLILSIRTDNPEAEIGLFENDTEVAYKKWHAHRQLAEGLHAKVRELLLSNKKDWKDIEAIVCYKGPGSFTGLRIGLSVANALANSMNIPIVGSGGGSWITDGIRAIQSGKNEKAVQPEYGAPVHITVQKK